MAAELSVTVTCCYFKASGKYYTDATASFPVELFSKCTYPREYGERLRELRQLPGLNAGNWDGPFTIEVKDQYTELVIPKERT